MARKASIMQPYRFPVMMSGILGSILTFYYTFSIVNQGRIKDGSKKFTQIPKNNIQERDN